MGKRFKEGELWEYGGSQGVKGRLTQREGVCKAMWNVWSHLQLGKSHCMDYKTCEMEERWRVGAERLNTDVESMGQLTKNKDMEKSVVE